MGEHQHKHDLIEPEGVNAGSADSTAEKGPAPGADVRGGGHPDRAAAQAGETEEDKIIDQPFLPRDAGAPSLDQSVEEGAR